MQAEKMSNHGGDAGEIFLPESRGSRAAETFGIGCPECGGSLRAQEGERSLRCSYCGSALLVADPKGYRSYILPPRITDGKARLQALRYIAEKTGGRVKARHSSIVDVRLINVPFWRMRGMLAGWISGETVRKRQVEVPSPGAEGAAIRRKTVEESHPYSKLVLKNAEWSMPACSLRHLGLQGISFKAGSMDWEAFDHTLRKKLNIALPMKSAAEAEESGIGYLSSLLTPPGSTVNARRLDLIGKDFSIYYYPVYILRYMHRGIIYTITVDACDARVIKGEHPLSRKIDLRSMFFVPAAAAILAGTWAPLLPAAGAAIYLSDIFHMGSFIAPHAWLMEKLERWFGGEL